MKARVSGVLAFAALWVSATAMAQFGDFLNKLQDKAKEKIDHAEDQVIDKATGSDNKSSSQDQSDGAKNTPGGSAAPATLASFKNYDFVPGDTVIFQSDLSQEDTGEIPSQFTLTHGQMDVQSEGGENVIHVPKGDGATFTPRMSKTSYMPDQFTVEFDFENERFGLEHLMVDFGQRVYYSGGEGITPGMTFGSEALTWVLGNMKYPDELTGAFQPMQWHHIAIAINKSVGKVYIDQYRVGNVNNLTGHPKEVTIDVGGYENSFVKNVRIAEGGIDIYKKMTTAAKIVTHGIQFDVDRATIRPASMGEINRIYKLLQKQSSIRFEVDGYTDNTGDAAHNLSLSQQRAEAVVKQLVSMGISADRLKAKGCGDTHPIAGNDSPEGRANNRRVEFVKI